MSHLPPVTQWGPPTAAKRALCIHGLCSSSQIWHYVANSLVDQGYQVIAPDLIGHGMAPASKDYSIKAMANALLPLLSSSPPFDLVVGHSLGTLIVLFLLPNLRFAGRGRVVLIDPPLEIGAGEPLEMTRKACVDQVLNIKSVQEYMTEMNWTEDDAVWRILGLQLCKPQMINSFFDHNMSAPWSFTPILPDSSSSFETVILGADPAFGGLFTPDEVEVLNRTHPHIKTRIITGASHLMFQDIPVKDLVVDEILGQERT